MVAFAARVPDWMKDVPTRSAMALSKNLAQPVVKEPVAVAFARSSPDCDRRQGCFCWTTKPLLTRRLSTNDGAAG